MPWLAVDDGSHCHPKVLQSGNAAWGLFIRCAAYCADQLTDGFVPKQIVRAYGSTAEIKRLAEIGLWEARDDGYMIPDYLDFNPSKVKVLAERARGARRQQEWRDRHVTNDVRNAVTNGVTNTAPSPPLPLVNCFTESSVVTDAGATDDDDRFLMTIDLLVDAKEQRNPPTRNPEQWRRVTRANTIAEDGVRVKALLDAYNGSPAATASLLELGLPFDRRDRHPDDCQVCDQGQIAEEDELGITRYRPCSERIVAS